MTEQPLNKSAAGSNIEVEDIHAGGNVGGSITVGDDNIIINQSSAMK